MTNEEIIELGQNIGIIDESFNEAHCHVLVIIDCMDKMVNLDLLDGTISLSDDGTKITKYLIDSGFIMNRQFTIEYLKSRPEQYIHLTPYEPFVEMLMEMYEHGEEYIMDKLTDIIIDLPTDEKAKIEKEFIEYQKSCDEADNKLL